MCIYVYYTFFQMERNFVASNFLLFFQIALYGNSSQDHPLGFPVVSPKSIDFFFILPILLHARDTNIFFSLLLKVKFFADSTALTFRMSCFIRLFICLSIHYFFFLFSFFCNIFSLPAVMQLQQGIPCSISSVFHWILNNLVLLSEIPDSNSE